jgi:hypothetical protein
MLRNALTLNTGIRWHTPSNCAASPGRGLGDAETRRRTDECAPLSHLFLSLRKALALLWRRAPHAGRPCTHHRAETRGQGTPCSSQLALQSLPSAVEWCHEGAAGSVHKPPSRPEQGRRGAGHRRTKRVGPKAIDGQSEHSGGMTTGPCTTGHDRARTGPTNATSGTHPGLPLHCATRRGPTHPRGACNDLANRQAVAPLARPRESERAHNWTDGDI